MTAEVWAGIVLGAVGVFFFGMAVGYLMGLREGIAMCRSASTGGSDNAG